MYPIDEFNKITFDGDHESEFRKFEKELRLLTDTATTTAKRGKILASQRGGQLLLLIASPCVKFLFGENAH